jgi:hypothetical protein
MNLTRRGLLGLFGIGAASAILDPELLAWKPGAKIFSVPQNIHVPTLHQFGVDFWTSSIDAPLSVEQFGLAYIEPALRSINERIRDQLARQGKTRAQVIPLPLPPSVEGAQNRAMGGIEHVRILRQYDVYRDQTIHRLDCLVRI